MYTWKAVVYVGIKYDEALPNNTSKHYCKANFCSVSKGPLSFEPL